MLEHTYFVEGVLKCFDDTNPNCNSVVDIFSFKRGWQYKMYKRKAIMVACVNTISDVIIKRVGLTM